MPPKRGARGTRTKKGAAKRPRLDADTQDTTRANLMEDSAAEDLYSPNVNSSDLSDSTKGEDEPRKNNTGGDNGKTPRRLRAARRAAERVHEDSTDNEKEQVMKIDAESQRSPTGINLLSDGEMESEDFRSTSYDSPGPGHLGLSAGAGGEGARAEQTAYPLVQEPSRDADSDLNSRGEGEYGVVSPTGSYHDSLFSGDMTPTLDSDEGEEAAGRPVRLEDIDLTRGAAARYIEFMTRRGRPPGFAREAREAPACNNWPRGGSPDYSPSSSGSSVGDDADDGDDDGGDKEAADSEADSGDDDDDSWPAHKAADDVLGEYIRRIGRALNFMVRAKASGIEVGDLDFLAAVSPEKWEELAEAPEYAADIVAKTLLEMPMSEVLRLSARADELRRDLGKLGIVID
ncbi:hypothetical protein F4802DRAFT_226967 [Xylaria palmicola]|nr:hypothetical protein F4802DRAFT_226967 [Xylaria palmicola]